MSRLVVMMELAFYAVAAFGQDRPPQDVLASRVDNLERRVSVLENQIRKPVVHESVLQDLPQSVIDQRSTGVGMVCDGGVCRPVGYYVAHSTATATEYPFYPQRRWFFRRRGR